MSHRPVSLAGRACALTVQQVRVQFTFASLGLGVPAIALVLWAVLQ